MTKQLLSDYCADFGYLETEDVLDYIVGVGVLDKFSRMLGYSDGESFLLLFVWRRSSIELMWFLDCNPVLKKNPKPFYLGSASNSRRPELARTCL